MNINLSTLMMLATVSLGLTPAMATAQLVSSVPSNPTYSICADIGRSYSQELVKLWQDNMQCIKDNPKVGLVRGCSGVSSWGFERCEGIALKICSITHQRDEINSRCMTEAAETAKRVSAADEAKRAAMDKARVISESAQETLDAVSHPVEFTRKILKDKYDKAVRDFIGADKTGKASEATFAEEVYKYQFGAAARAMKDYNQNKLVSIIQQESLRRINETFQQALNSFDTSIAAIDVLLKLPPSSSEREPVPIAKIPPVTASPVRNPRQCIEGQTRCERGYFINQTIVCTDGKWLTAAPTSCEYSGH